MEIEPSSECSCYYMETVSLQGNDGKTVTFRNNGAEPSLVFSDKGREAGTYIQFTIEDSNVYLFGHYAICYYENGIPYILRMDSLNQSGEHLVVIELLRHLLEEGNLFVFEYAGNYLVKYDPTFIASYIQRYSRGQFTENELRWMEESFYNPGYIIDLAKDLAK